MTEYLTYFHSLSQVELWESIPRKSAAIETHRRPRCTVCTPWGERRRCTALESAFGRKRIIEGVPLRESSPRFSFFMILYVLCVFDFISNTTELCTHFDPNIFMILLVHVLHLESSCSSVLEAHAARRARWSYSAGLRYSDLKHV